VIVREQYAEDNLWQ